MRVAVCVCVHRRYVFHFEYRTVLSVQKSSVLPFIRDIQGGWMLSRRDLYLTARTWNSTFNVKKKKKFKKSSISMAFWFCTGLWLMICSTSLYLCQCCGLSQEAGLMLLGLYSELSVTVRKVEWACSDFLSLLKVPEGTFYHLAQLCGKTPHTTPDIKRAVTLLAFSLCVCFLV